MAHYVQCTTLADVIVDVICVPLEDTTFVLGFRALLLLYDMDLQGTLLWDFTFREAMYSFMSNPVRCAQSAPQSAHLQRVKMNSDLAQTFIELAQEWVTVPWTKEEIRQEKCRWHEHGSDVECEIEAR